MGYRNKMRKSLFCLFLFVMTLPAFSDSEFTIDTPIDWNSTVVVEALKSAGLDQNTSNKILFDLLGRDKFSVGDAVLTCMLYCKTLDMHFGPCEDFGINLISINNKLANCPKGSYNIGFSECITANLDGNDFGAISNNGAHSKNVTKYNLTPKGSWAVEFGYGIIKGTSSCEKVPHKKTKDCYCKMTHPTTSVWVSPTDYPSAVLSTKSSFLCDDTCAHVCADFINKRPDFRSVVFSSVGQ